LQSQPLHHPKSIYAGEKIQQKVIACQSRVCVNFMGIEIEEIIGHEKYGS